LRFVIYSGEDQRETQIESILRTSHIQIGNILHFIPPEFDGFVEESRSVGLRATDVLVLRLGVKILNKESGPIPLFKGNMVRKVGEDFDVPAVYFLFTFP